MILTCPNCATQYVVKDTAIPPQGRSVRCASCQHRWHQDPPAASASADPVATDAGARPTGIASEPGFAAALAAVEAKLGAAAETGFDAPRIDPSPDAGAAPVAAHPVAAHPVAAMPTGVIDPYALASAPVEPAAPAPPAERDAGMSVDPSAPVAPAMPVLTGAEDDEPHLDDEPVDRQDDVGDWTSQPYVAADEDIERAPARRWPVLLLVLLLLVAAGAALAYYLGGPALLQRVGLASGRAAPLEVMVTSKDRQKLASGNELLAVSGRVINPTGIEQRVPPLTAELRDAAGRTLYAWTIAPPAASLAPGASASFNSAEMNVPQGGDRITVRLGTAAR